MLGYSGGLMNRAMASGVAERPQRGCMRVVVLEPSEENRNVLTRELDQLQGFALVGQSSNWDECLVLLRALVPELLIAPTSFAPGSRLLPRLARGAGARRNRPGFQGRCVPKPGALFMAACFISVRRA